MVPVSGVWCLIWSCRRRRRRRSHLIIRVCFFLCRSQRHSLISLAFLIRSSCIIYYEIGTVVARTMLCRVLLPVACLSSIVMSPTRRMRTRALYSLALSPSSMPIDRGHLPSLALALIPSFVSSIVARLSNSFFFRPFTHRLSASLFHWFQGN